MEFVREVGLPGGRIIVHGHWGRPVLVFPTERGSARDAESNGLVAAVDELLSAGRVKLYCVDSHDAASWSAADKPLEERARAHEHYESWILATAVPFIAEDCGMHSHTTACATSSGVTKRCCGLPDARAERAWSALRPVFATMLPTASSTIAVSVKPGQTAFTVTPLVASSSASARVRPTRPCLAAQYALT